MDRLESGHLRPWIGRTERQSDEIASAPQRGLWAVLDREGASPGRGEDIVPLSHWLYFGLPARQDQLGSDGHPARGGFLPPVSLSRRMWARGSLEFHHPLRVGEEAVRESRITEVAVKEGRSGPLVFVTVRHDITDVRGLALTETQDIVYREVTRAGAPATPPAVAPTGETFAREIVPDPVLLFRYSALTFNSHRIHYDQHYATQVEGYPGLVVHGPLIATLLLELLQRRKPGARVRRFSFKAVSPLFDTHPFTVCGRAEGPHDFTLWARSHEGWLAMQAGAEIA
jgi:3-methylfumaryl-CoA hydratase